MPIYEYECPQCGIFECEQRISEEPLKKCPECQKKGATNEVKRIISASAFHLKGGGWYKTDYTSGAQNSSKSSNSSGEAAGASDSGSTGTKEAKEGAAKEKKSLKKAGCGGGCTCH